MLHRAGTELHSRKQKNMEITHLPEYKTRAELRQWLEHNHSTAKVSMLLYTYGFGWHYLSLFDKTLTKDCTRLPEEFSAYYKRNVWVTPIPRKRATLRGRQGDVRLRQCRNLATPIN